ncbi:MAG: membrane lipoprotein lipid attachment site-containing protein [Patescibacteria group bacterium]|nr:membrane lipoprotein lipid attachment site-containing protein [Patescibacteria group bacterium]
MKKIIFVLCLSLLLAGCANNGSQTSAQGQPVSGSIEDLIKLGKNYRCELQFKEGDQITSGTTYLSGSSARTDYQMKSGTQTINSHAIMTSTTIYSWVDEMPAQALKISQADLKQFQSQAQTTSPSVSSYQNKYDYKCYSWTPDQSKFTPPAGIKFTDYSAFLKQLQGQLPNLNVSTPGTSNLCASCNAITDTNTKAMCKQQLGCK